MRHIQGKKMVIAGGTGFIGQSTAKYFIEKGFHLIILSRRKQQNQENIRYVTWDGKTLGEWKDTLEGAEILINMAGRTVNCRYNEKNKQQIYDSRLYSTRILGEAVNQCKIPPKLWINAGSATIYRHALDRPMDEDTGEFGTGFSVDVCQKWEEAFHQIKTSSTRKVFLRIAMVLGKDGGVMTPMLNLVKWGLGGTQGKGNQYISWIHEQDFNRIVEWFMENPEKEGTFNCAAPNPVPNVDFMRTLRNVYKQPFGLPATRWMLELGAWCIGTETELIVKSRRVVPKKLLDAGFVFQYPQVKEAVINLIK